MNYKHLVLAGIFFVECIVLGLVGFRVYRLWAQRQSVLGAHHVTRISKEMVAFPSDTYLKGFYEPKPNAVEQDTSSWLPSPVTYRTNSVGMKSDREYSIQKPANIFRVMTIGDSFTWGQGVHLEDTFPSKLEKKFNEHACNSPKKIEVINLGVSGYDIQYTVEHFRRLGQQYHPDLVIWLVNEHNVLQLRDLVDPLADQIDKETSPSAKQKYFSENNYYFAYVKATNEIELQLGDTTLFAAQRTALHQLSQLHEGPLAIFMFEWNQQKVKDVMHSYAKNRQYTYFTDTLPNLYDINEAALPDSHPSSLGHELIAARMYNFLKEKNIINCR